MFVGYRVGSRLPGLSNSGGRPRCLQSVRVLGWTCTHVRWRRQLSTASPVRSVRTIDGYAPGNTIGSFIGLVPTEYSSGTSRVQGAITKTGNTHVRRLLVEAAWHHRPRYQVGAVMRARWDQAPAAARARGDQGNRRLHHRWVGFLQRRKRPVIANVAVARELAGWCWSLAVMAD